jgi:uncharacterized DUF497 family protein
MSTPSEDFTPVPLAAFDWDRYNTGHIAEHNVTPAEAEQVILGDPLDFGFDADSSGEERWTYLGETSWQRLLMVVITIRGDKLRVVTAFEPDRRDKLLYLKTKAGLNDDHETS